MFLLSIKNNDKQLELYRTRSQVELDRFTTCFSNEEALLKRLGLGNEFKIVVQKNTNKDEGLVEIPFTGSKYRNVIYNFNNDEYLKEVSNSKERLYMKLYFMNELLRFEKELSYYESKKYKTLKKIISFFETTDGLYFNDHTLFYLMKDYFEDNYGFFKDFYKYMTNFKKDEPRYDDNSKKEVIEVLKSMSDTLNDVTFEEKNEEKKEKLDIHELEFNNIIQSERDLDQKVEEINMFIDEYKTNEIEELGKKFINKL